MKSTLINGKIIPPKSLGAARTRHGHLVREIARIDRQIADPVSRSKHTSQGDYDVWLAKATRARRYMAEEARQLSAWIDANPETNLLREATDLLVRLRDEVDLDDDELAVIARLEGALPAVAAGGVR